MDLTRHLAVSYYKTIATIDEAHKIYLAQHQETRKIAIKKILDVYNADVYKYLSLYPIAGTPKILAFCEEDHQLTVIEEYISGCTLKDKMQQHSISVSDIVRYMIDLCTILQPLHHTKPPIIHRDIKPSNIMIDCWNHAVLLDFNAAKFFSPGRTEDTVLLGTMGYAAPEQYGFGSSSPQTDIYSIGILLKELSDSLAEPCHLFDAVIETCTKLNADERYKSVNDLRKSMEMLSPVHYSRKASKGIQAYALPGYRSHSPWKMLLASIYYLFVLWISATFQVKNTFGMALFFYKVCVAGILLSWVFAYFNYKNIQNWMPLCHHKNRIVRHLGMLLLTIALVLFLFSILCTSQVFFTL